MRYLKVGDMPGILTFSSTTASLSCPVPDQYRGPVFTCHPQDSLEHLYQARGCAQPESRGQLAALLDGLRGTQSKLTSETVFSYRLPSLRVGSEGDFLSFTLARAQDVLAAKGILCERKHVLSDFKAAIWAHSIPVLIVHGGRDRVVDLGQSQELQRYLRADDEHARLAGRRQDQSKGGSGCQQRGPEVQLEINLTAGHTGSEEDPEWFVSKVAAFVRGV